MKKILIVDMGQARGGIERYIYNIYRNIDKNRFKIDFLIYNQCCAYQDEFLKNGSKIYKVVSRKKNPLSYKSNLKKFFKMHNYYDFIWVQTCSASNISAHKYAKQYTRAKLVTHAHVVQAEVRGKIHKLVTAISHKINQKLLVDLTDIALACSREAGEYLFGKENINQVKIVRNGIDLKKYENSFQRKLILREKWGIEREEIVLGHVGRFSKVKNHNFLVEVFKCFHSNMPNSKLLLVGEGEQKNFIEDKLRKMNLLENVIFTGERDDVADIMAMMDLFVFPSFNEGFGIAVIEAQATHCPCLINEDLSNMLDVSNLIHRMSLKESPQKWAKELECILHNDDLDSNNELYKFDIGYTAKEIEQLFRRE